MRCALRCVVEYVEPPHAHHAFIVAGTVGAGGSSTLNGNLAFGTEVLLRLFHMNAGISLDLARGDGTSASAAFVAGPSFTGFPLDVETLVMIGSRSYNAVGGSHSGGGLFEAGCSAPGASGNTTFMGARIGLSSPAHKQWSLSISVALYYRADGTSKTVPFHGSCYSGGFLWSTTTKTWDDARVIGGHEAGLVLRLGGQRGF